jgi:adenine-specific DNA methylase
MQPSRIGAASMTVGQNAHLTFRANAAAGRHGWLRLTPACSYRLVAEALAGTEPGARVLDPFSGSGTTGLLAVEAGLDAVLVDVNPFLVWLATAKTRRYDDRDLTDARERARGVLAAAGTLAGRAGLWQPPIHRIDRWWTPPALEALKSLRAALDDHPDGGPATDLLLVAFCRTLIAVSGAAFDHQSLSFKAAGPARVADVLDRYRLEADQVVADAARFQTPVAGRAVVRLGDARSLAGLVDRPVEVLFTSPPYANRVSYVRELRPYMYWLRFMDAATQAGELDWSAIGGTWGVATSRLAEWAPVDPVPLDGSFPATLRRVAAAGHPSGRLLARYVERYFADMFRHFEAAREVMAPGGRVVYVVGNSTFFGHQVPTQEWYAQLLAQAGFTGVGVATLRKRNSKAALYEYAVTASAG